MNRSLGKSHGHYGANDMESDDDAGTEFLVPAERPTEGQLDALRELTRLGEEMGLSDDPK